ncbi:HPP family protein [Candidatus Nanohalococcus occultus]|uniref:CBS domain n=1 Tax=Candidatus Nanohalococcus occultus TaxID=2978047 RepID=A0ABY8CIS2_9ARCH|nr:CBS domain [Candidatus Nanohaloarchaeota archaeon SVXNc]
MKTARELMDEPDFIEADASVEEVMEEVKGIENTLIVRKEGKVVGEIHENSLLKVLVPEEKVDEEKVIGILGFSFDSSYVAETAEDLMSKHNLTVEPDEDVGDLAFLMDKEDLRSLPVEEDGEIIGVVHENHLIEEIE